MSGLSGVSILAHPERWALQGNESQSQGGEGFQSSPTPKGGRYAGHRALLPVRHSFNPRPPRKVGATTVASFERRDPHVSILAHPERWALRCRRTRTGAGAVVSILAHPERWALRRASPARGRSRPVSILAHPERWALPREVFCTRCTLGVSILAHPERWALPGWTRSRSGTWLFQSSPTPKGGRYDGLALG